MTEGSSRPADGTVALNAGIKGDPGDPADPGLLSGSQATRNGRFGAVGGQHHTGVWLHAAGDGYGQASGRQRPDSGRHGHPTFGCRRRLAHMVGQPDPATALGLVGVLGLGSAGAFFVLRKKQPLAEAA
jgi:putative membrane protein